ncbi:MAG: restriction endonuclease subunit S [Nitrospirae bacterium]|nr:restriction endonuclease subunit S [Nitrospirota bacterium]
MEAARRYRMVRSNDAIIQDLSIVEIQDIPEEDLSWSTVSLSEVIERDCRLEASVYNIEGKHAREVLKKNRWKNKTVSGENGLATVYHRPRFKRIFVEKSDFPIYQPSQVNEIYPKPYLYISEMTETDIESLRVTKNQILMTCSGTIGNCTLVSRTLNGCILSHDLLRIKAKDGHDTGYIYTFLKTKTGRTLVNTNNYGAVVEHIEPAHLANIPIPDAPIAIRKEIDCLIIKSFELRDESNDLIDEAHKLMIPELKLPPIEKIRPIYYDKTAEFKNYTVKLSRLNNRLDSSYHIPIVDSIMGILKETAGEITTLGDNRISKEIMLPGRFKRVYVIEGQGVVFFGGKQLHELDPSNNKYLSLTHHASRIKKELTIKENFILVTRSGTIGRITIVPKHWENWIASEHIIRIVPLDKSIAGYVYCWLSSDYGYELIKRFTYGSVVDEIDDTHMSQVQIPLLKNKTIQEKINTLVLTANQKRYEAYILEQKAIMSMNDAVIFAEA